MPDDLLNAAEVEVDVVLFDSEQDRFPKPVRAHLREILGTAPAIRPVKQGAPCYSGAAYRPGTTRGLAGVEAVTLLVLDYDHLSAAQLHQLLDRLAGKLYAIHTSYSDRAGGPDDRCVRVVLILTRPLAQQEFRVVRAAVVAELGVPADDRAADAARIWFKPSTPPGRADGAFITYASGAPLDPSAYVGPPTPGTPITPTPVTPAPTPTPAQQPGPRTARQVRARLRKVSDPESRELARRMAEGEPLADAGGRNDALWTAMCIAAFIVPDATPEVLVEVAQPSLAAMAAAAPEGRPAPTLQTAADMAGRALQRAAEQGVRVFERGDETEIAVHLVEALATTEPPAHDEGAFWRYREATGLWETVEDEEVSRTIQRFAGSGVLRDKNTRELRITASVVRGARELAAARARCPRFFEEAVPGFAFTNGFVRVDGDGLHPEPHSSAHRARVGYPFPFDPSARAARFEQFRAEVFAGDPDAVQKNECLQEFTGACLIGRATRPAKAIVMVGEGRNGKSTYQDIVSACVPEGAKESIPPHYWEQEYYREKLRGVLLNLVPELPKTDILRSEAFKAITAGDTIVARAIRKAPVRFRPVAGHLFAANTLPAVDDASRAFWARIIVITFNNVFSVDQGNADTDLAARIVTSELPGVVLWALQGAVRLLSRGTGATYTTPASHQAALQEWRLRADSVAEFLSEMTVPATAPATRTSGRMLFDTFVAWAAREKRQAMASNTFGARVKALGVRWVKPDSQIMYAVSLTPEAHRLREAASRRPGTEYRPDPVIPSFRRSESGNPSVVAPMPAPAPLPSPPYPPGPPGFNGTGNGSTGNLPQG